MVTAMGTGHRVSPSAVMSLGIVGPFRAQVSCAVVCLDDRARTVAYISCLSTIAGTQVGCLRHRTIKALPQTSGGARLLHVLIAMVAHRILEAAYFILRDKVPYRELGDQYLDAHHWEHIIRHHVQRLESLGLHIDIRELPLTG